MNTINYILTRLSELLFEYFGWIIITIPPFYKMTYGRGFKNKRIISNIKKSLDDQRDEEYVSHVKPAVVGNGRQVFKQLVDHIRRGKIYECHTNIMRYPITVTMPKNLKYIDDIKYPIISLQVNIDHSERWTNLRARVIESELITPNHYRLILSMLQGYSMGYDELNIRYIPETHEVVVDIIQNFLPTYFISYYGIWGIRLFRLISGKSYALTEDQMKMSVMMMTTQVTMDRVNTWRKMFGYDPKKFYDMTADITFQNKTKKYSESQIEKFLRNKNMWKNKK